MVNLDRNLYLTSQGVLCEDGHKDIKVLVGLRGMSIDDERARTLGIEAYLQSHPLPRRHRPEPEPTTPDVPEAEAKMVELVEVENKAVELAKATAAPDTPAPEESLSASTEPPSEPSPPGVRWPPDARRQRGR